MTTRTLQRPALVLNRNWQPVNVATVARALVLLWNEAARVVDPRDFQLYTWADWSRLRPADGDAVVFYRQPLRRRAPDTEFDISDLDALPRVDISYAYAGGDGTAVRAFVAAGARGIVSAGFAPGFTPPGEAEALREAASRGIVVVQSTRAGSGRTFRSTRLKASGLLIADNLNPQKARILLALALTRSQDPDEIMRIFRTY